MEPHALGVKSEVKLEIDIAEETPLGWMTENNEQDQLADSSQNGINLLGDCGLCKMEPHALGVKSEVKLEIDIAEETPLGWMTENTEQASEVCHDTQANQPAAAVDSHHDTCLIKEEREDAVSAQLMQMDETKGTHVFCDVNTDTKPGLVGKIEVDSTEYNVDQVHDDAHPELSAVTNTDSDSGMRRKRRKDKVSVLLVKTEDMREDSRPHHNASSDARPNVDMEVDSRECSSLQAMSSTKVHCKGRDVEEKQYKCTQCDATFSLSGNLEMHMQVHTGETPYSCAERDATFNQSSHLKTHMRTHSGEKPYSCMQYGGTSTRYYLKIHMRTHSGEKSYYYLQCKGRDIADKQYRCTQCDATFTKSGNLKMHMRVHTGETPYSCAECSAAFTKSRALKKHTRTHSGEKPHSCTQCGATFTQSGNLKEHMRTYSGEKTYSCLKCDATFTESDQLEIHMLRHSGEKPYFCIECGATFTESDQLKKHTKTHYGEKKYSCQQCSATFTRSITLEKHMRTHSEEKLYSCQQCGATFTWSSSLKRHMKTHSGEKPYSCMCCGATFTRSGYLKTHMTTHSREELCKTE